MSRRFSVVASLAFASCLATTSAIAADITVWTASALAKVLRQVGSQFEASTGSRLLISEDSQHGRTFGGVTIVNPFVTPQSPLLAEALE